MSKITNVNELPFSSEELVYFEVRMRQYKVPWIYKIVYGSLYKWGRFFMPILFLIIATLGVIHISTHIDLWNVIKGFAFFWIFFIGGAVLIAFLAQRFKVFRARKKLGLTLYQWNLLATVFNITYI